MAPLETTPIAANRDGSPASPPDRALLLERTGWAAVAILCVGLLAASLPRRFAELREPPDVAVRTAIAALGVSPTFHAGYNLAIELAGALGFLLLAGLIAWRRWRDPAAIGVSAVLIAFGTALPGTSYALISNQPIWQVSPAPLQAIGWAGLLLFALLFPDGRFVPRGARLLVVPWLVWVAGFFLFAGTLTRDRPAAIGVTYVAWIGWFGLGALAQLYRYRYVSDARQRQQTKWVVLGFAGALVGAATASVQSVLSLTTGRAGYNSVLYEGAAVALLNLSALLIPLSIAVAILRHNLYDIDRLINRTLVYATLTAILALIYVTCVALLQVIVSGLTGQHGQSPIALVVSTLATVALVQPLRGRIQHGIDRRFFRRRYDAAHTLEAFAHTLRHEVQLLQLQESLLAVVADTLQPEHVSLWLAPTTATATARAEEPPRAEGGAT
ncbi:MAG TPA: hypothetical protein VF116_14415 [Ktedonobacterales bacterium]